MSKSNKEILNQFSIEELAFIQGKYCRPDMLISCEKKFGTTFTKKEIQDIIDLKCGDFLLGEEQKENPDFFKEAPVNYGSSDGWDE